MGIIVIPGTLLGRRLLKQVSEAQFVILNRIALVVTGLKVLGCDGVWQLL